MGLMSYNDRALERQAELLEEDFEAGRIDEPDYDAIADFMEYDASENASGTVTNHMVKLRTIAKSDLRLVEADVASLNRLLRDFKSGKSGLVKEDGVLVGNHISSLRVFYRFHDNLGADPDDLEFEDLHGDYDGRELSPEDLLYQPDVDDLLRAARRQSIRDEALIALTLATGQRVDAIRTLRMEHIIVDGPTMEIKLNEEEGDLKGARGSKPLIWAKHYVRPWYEAHPHRDDDDAALFPSKANGHNDLSPDASGWTRDPIGKSQLGRIVKDRAAEAGIEKDVYPHLLRHCALTRMAAEGDLNEQQIKNLVGWGGDSSQFETYVHLADEIATDSVRESMGLPTSDSGAPVVGRPSLDRCPNCGDRLPEGHERCLTCNEPLTQAEAERGGGGGTDLEALMPYLEGMGDEELGQALRQIVDQKTAEEA